VLINEDLLGSNIKTKELLFFVPYIMDRWKMITNKRKTLVNLQNNIYVEKEHNAFGMITRSRWV
jgi:hypothetical protein